MGELTTDRDIERQLREVSKLTLHLADTLNRRILLKTEKERLNDEN